MTHTIAIKRLPYMGIPVDSKVKRAVQPSLEIPFSALHEYELEQVEARLQVSTDPFDVLAGKVEHLAQLLGCSEAQAERVLFARLK